VILDHSALGRSDWPRYLVRRKRRPASPIAALRLGLDGGMKHIDNAEMYNSGAAERLVGEAIAGRRDKVFLVSKVLPQNAGRRTTIEARRNLCFASRPIAWILTASEPLSGRSLELYRASKRRRLFLHKVITAGCTGAARVRGGGAALGLVQHLVRQLMYKRQELLRLGMPGQDGNASVETHAQRGSEPLVYKRDALP
jgi:hypothetical protein